MSGSEYQRLIAFLGERFEVIDRRFEAIDWRFDTVDRRFQAIDQRFDAIDQRFDELRGEIPGHFDEVYRRLERLEQEYQAITQTLRRIEALLADERARREILERDLATLRENVAVLHARIEDIERRLHSS
jgi:predicted  nucleic acid-binding Zn-ribbon protein